MELVKLKILALRDDAKKLANENDKLNAENDLIRSALEKLETENSSLKRSTVKLERELERVERKLAELVIVEELTDGGTKCHRKFQLMENTLSAFEQKAGEMQMKFDQACANADHLEKENKQKQRKITLLEMELGRAEQDLKECKENFAATFVLLAEI